MRIVQWNIWFKERVDNVYRILSEINPDIACLQEITLDSQENPKINTAEYIAKKLNMNFYYKDSQKWKDGPRREQGNAILSKYPIMKSKYTYIQEQSKVNIDASKEGRVYIESDIKIKNKILKVGTTHLTYSHIFEVTEMRKKEFENLLTSIKGNKESYILTGDLNIFPDSVFIKRLNKYFINSGPDFSIPTWTTKPFDKWGFKEDELRWRLDYVFSTNDIKIINSDIYNTEYSDHLPVIVDFSF